MAHWVNTIDVKDLWEEGDFHKIAESASQQQREKQCGIDKKRNCW